MISLKFANSFQFENKVSLTDLLEVCKNNRVLDDLGVAQRSFGWCNISEPAILQTPNHLPYLIGRFVGKVRSAPRELLKRMLTSELKKRERNGEGTTKEMASAIEADIQSKLAQDLEPELLEGYVIITSNGEMFVTSKKRPYIDPLVNGLTFLLFEKGFTFKPKRLAVSKSNLRMLAEKYDSLSCNVVEVMGKNSSGVIRLDPHGSALAFYKQTLTHSEIERITIHHNHMLYLTLTHKGLIHDIKFGEEFESEWRNYGDGEASEMLDLIRTGIWVDNLLFLLTSTQRDVDNMSGAVGFEDGDEETNNGVAPQPYSSPNNNNVVKLFS